MQPIPEFDPKATAKKLMRECRSWSAGDIGDGFGRSLLLIG